jgi:hypothetical protein
MKKARPDDRRLIHDTSADRVDRASAAARLAADGQNDHLPLVFSWLDDEDWHLRTEATSLLLTGWRHEPALLPSIRLACDDPNPLVREGVAVSLGSLSRWAVEHRRAIVAPLMARLRVEPDPDVASALYAALLSLTGSDRDPDDLPFDFDVSRDVDWEPLHTWCDSSSA